MPAHRRGSILPFVPSPSQFVLTFLESVGRRQEAEYYLKLFRELPKASFAAIVTESQLLESTPSMVVEPLRFLSRLGLFPVLTTGLFDDATSPPRLEALLAELRDRGVNADAATQDEPNWLNDVRNRLEAGSAAVVHLNATSEESRYEGLGRLLTTLGTRKLAILRARGGLGRKQRGQLALTETHRLVTNENGISVVNLTTDFVPLRDGEYLDAEERLLLGHVNDLHRLHPQLLTSIASPLNLLRELFTVRGAGTLIKTGSTILRIGGYAQLDLPRVVQLLEQTFGRRLSPAFTMQPLSDVYLEQAYRGVAICAPGVVGSFLSKFAVNRKAQGEGIGRDLWEAMLRDHPTVYWRARSENPASEWYQTECDGMHRIGEWRVFWRGVRAADVPTVIDDAMSRPFDFLDAAP